MPSSNLDMSGLFMEREAQRGSMHTRHLNEQLVRVLKTIGYDVGFQKGQGAYLYDREGDRYLDLLSGFGVFAVGRNRTPVGLRRRRGQSSRCFGGGAT